MHARRAQSSPADRSVQTWLEVGEETEWWVGNGDAPVPNVTLCSAFQPIFSLGSSDVSATEALLRAYFSDGEQISPPALFARRSVSAGISLDKLCHRTHLHNAASVLRTGERLFLNFRPETLCLEGYADELVQSAKNANLSPGQVVVEVVESGCSLHHLADGVEQFRSHGFQIALDDFGAGLSNVDRLIRLMPEVVKLDRSLLVSAMQNTHAAGMFERLVSLLHESESAVIVEGVETQADLDFAIAMQVDMVQGFYLARPASLRMPYGHATNVICNARHTAYSGVMRTQSGIYNVNRC